MSNSRKLDAVLFLLSVVLGFLISQAILGSGVSLTFPFAATPEPTISWDAAPTPEFSWELMFNKALSPSPDAPLTVFEWIEVPEDFVTQDGTVTLQVSLHNTSAYHNTITVGASSYMLLPYERLRSPVKITADVYLDAGKPSAYVLLSYAEGCTVTVWALP